MQILITGIHGFVGLNLVASLSGKHTIYGLSQRRTPMQGVQKMYAWEDLEKNQIPTVDAIIHLAGKAHDTKNQTEAQVYFDINLGLTRRIYDNFRAGTAHTFIQFSSVKAAADKVVGESLTEEVVPTPKGPYGESKIEAERYLLTHPAEGKSVYILRPCMMYGKGNKGNLNLLYKLMRRGLPWPLGAFENRRSFASIENVAYVLDLLLSKKIDSGIYNIADDGALSTNELVEVICEAMGKKARIWTFGKGLMTRCAKWGDKCHLPLNTERLTKLTEDYVVSNAKIKRALGIERMPVQSRDGLKETIRSFCQDGSE